MLSNVRLRWLVMVKDVTETGHRESVQRSLIELLVQVAPTSSLVSEKQRCAVLPGFATDIPHGGELMQRCDDQVEGDGCSKHR